MLEAMDALILMNTAGSGDALSEISAQLTEVLNRARVADGVVAYLQAPAPEAGAGQGAGADLPAGGLGQTEDDLALSSEVADAFDGIDDLAAGLACNFDVVVLADGVIAADGRPVDWAETAAGDGAVLSDAAQTWLRM